jgi:hypothetical protein
MSHQPVNCGNSLGLSDAGLAASTARSGCSARVDIRSASWGRVPPLKWEKCDGFVVDASEASWSDLPRHLAECAKLKNGERAKPKNEEGSRKTCPE